MKSIFRRIRGALGNAIIWAGVWFLGSLLTIFGVYLFGVRDLGLFWQFLPAFLRVSALNAGIGFITGGLFSAYVAAEFRGRKLEELNPGRFAFGGALVSVALALLAVTWFRFEGIGELPLLGSLIRPMIYSATMGGLTGFASAKLAQRSLPAGPESLDELQHRPTSFLR
jgi:hypothetical protein